MMHVNLSTRPFYNERGVALALGTLTAVLVVVSLFNAWHLAALSSRHTTVAAAAAADEQRAAMLRRDAAGVRASVPREDLEQVLADAREANALIGQRTFSWTALLNTIETTLPPDVRIDFVRPQFSGEGVSIALGVTGRRIDDIETFVRRLETSGTFSGVLIRDEQAQDDGTFRASVGGLYDATGAAKPAATRAAGGAR